MRKLLATAAAFGLFTVLGAGNSQADVINNANVWINQPSAATGCSPPSPCSIPPPLVPTPPIAGFLVPAFGAEISFNLTSSATNPGIGTVTQFANSSPPMGSWAVMGNAVPTPTLDATPLSDGGARTFGTIFEFTGSFTTNGTQDVRIVHDDGIRGFIDATPFADLVPNPAHSTDLGNFTGTHTFDLFYGECCTIPAVLEFFVGDRQVTNNVPEPASLALLGSALLGFGVFKRRRTS